MSYIPPPGLICCVCTGFHHPDDCSKAVRFIAECRSLVSYVPAPVPIDHTGKERLFMERRQAQLAAEAERQRARSEHIRQRDTERNRRWRARRSIDRAGAAG